MGKVTVQDYTTKFPLQMIGEEAGICWNANIEDKKKNIKRAIDCIESGHGRTLEFPQVYLTIDGYSARVIRELYTHIAGGPTRLQASTRYVDYGEFEYVMPPSIANDESYKMVFESVINHIKQGMEVLDEHKVPREDITMLLPLGMTTKIVLRTNLRNLIDMSRLRMCRRAYWEFWDLMRDISLALKDYSEEWEEIVRHCFKPKCVEYGFCNERNSCGQFPKKEKGEWNV